MSCGLVGFLDLVAGVSVVCGFCIIVCDLDFLVGLI